MNSFKSITEFPYIFSQFVYTKAAYLSVSSKVPHSHKVWVPLPFD